MKVSSTLIDKILSALKSSSYWTEKSRVSDKTLQGITCPVCGGKGEAWAYADSPMSLNCNRGKCGARTRTIELFDIHQNIERDFPSCKQDPNRPARAYLESRSLRESLTGLVFEYWPNVRKTGSGAVMFPVGKDDTGKEISNGRLISPPPGTKKTHNSGSTSGRFWRHPGRAYDPGQPVYIVEGIIDSLSIIELGFQAVAVLASGQDPAKVDLSEFPRLVLGFDNDQAGINATKKWNGTFPQAEIVMLDPGQDWNDILRSGPPDQVKKQFDASIDRYRLNGRLALALSAREYATLWREFHDTPPGLFTWGGCTWYSYLKNKNDELVTIVERVLQATIQVQSYLADHSDPSNPQTTYHLQLIPSKGRPVDAIATGRDLATLRALKEFFLTRKQNFEAGAPAATALAGWITNAKAPEVQQLSLTGYDHETSWYCFKTWGIDQIGKLHTPDKRGLFKISHNEFRAPATHAGEKSINPGKSGLGVKEMFTLLNGAWGDKGAVALSWTIAGWFVNQIKERIGFFPFLSLWGDPASGKSALTVTLNALQGIDGEGLPLSQLNTRKAIARIISRQAGLFTACLEETNRDQQKAFDYSMLLTGYNKGPLSLQAVFSADNRVMERPFRGSLMFVNNQEPFNSQAERQRVISLHFSSDQLTDQTRTAYEKLALIPLPEISRVIQNVLQQRTIFENEWFSEYDRAIADLSPLDNRRILQNHALILAFHRIFCRVFKINDDLKDFLKELALQKCISSAARNFTPADHFFQQLDLLYDDSDDEKNQSIIFADKVTGQIFINLPGCEAKLRNKGLSFIVNENLTKSLTSHPAFIKNGHNFRFPDGETDTSGRIRQKKAWVFDALKINES